MLRLIRYVVLVALAIAGAVWLADHPGRVAVEWLGWRFETSVAALLAVLLACGVALVLVLRWAVALVRLPGEMARQRREVRLKAGYQALSDGLMAAAGGAAPTARKLAGRADKLLGDPALTTFLSAQAARLSGDRDAAHSHFERMLDRPETAAFGLKGLLEQALEDGDDTEAQALATRVLAADPGDSWTADVAFGLMAKNGRWDDALALIATARRRGAFSKIDAAHRRALILDAQATRALADNDARRAADLARQATRADPALTAAALRLAAAESLAGREKRASQALEAAWKRRPAMELAKAYADLRSGEDTLARLRRLGKLVASQPNAPETHLALGEAALDAKLWGQARTHLKTAAEMLAGPRPLLLLARLEREEYGNENASRQWAALAAAAPPDPAWICGSCGAKAPQWTLTCPVCGGIDRLAWGRPKPAVEAPATAISA